LSQISTRFNGFKLSARTLVQGALPSQVPQIVCL
jgi:hypothetical protein